MLLLKMFLQTNNTCLEVTVSALLDVGVHVLNVLLKSETRDTTFWTNLQQAFVNVLGVLVHGQANFAVKYFPTLVTFMIRYQSMALLVNDEELIVIKLLTTLLTQVLLVLLKHVFPQESIFLEEFFTLFTLPLTKNIFPAPSEPLSFS